jgi:putative RecB family exonuclease
MDHLSSSQINLYLLCSLKYRYQYIDKLPKPFQSSALAFGSVFHSALSWLHTERHNGVDVTLENLYRRVESDWDSQRVETDIRYKDGEEELKLAIIGKEMLGMYFREPHRDIAGTEVHFTVPLVNPQSGERLGINLEGYFDLVEADETIVEFKTSAQALTLGDIKVHLQLTAYGYAYNLLHRRPPKGYRIVNFVKTSKPRLEVTETKRSESNFEAFFHLAEQVLNGITKGVFIPKPGYWCKDCEYASVCPLWKHKTEAVKVARQAEVVV